MDILQGFMGAKSAMLVEGETEGYTLWRSAVHYNIQTPDSYFFGSLIQSKTINMTTEPGSIKKPPALSVHALRFLWFLMMALRRWWLAVMRD